MITKVMLPNSFFVQRSKLFGVPYKRFIKEHGFDRRKILNINSKELSKHGDKSSNANSTNKAITNELNSPLKKSTQSNLFILNTEIKNKEIIKGDYLIRHSSCID